VKKSLSSPHTWVFEDVIDAIPILTLSLLVVAKVKIQEKSEFSVYQISIVL